MLNLINTLDVIDPVVVHSLCSFFYDFCRTFGHTFTITKVRRQGAHVMGNRTVGIPDMQERKLGRKELDVNLSFPFYPHTYIHKY